MEPLHASARKRATRGNGARGKKGRARCPSKSARARRREETGELLWSFILKLLLVAVILVAMFRFVLGVHIQRGMRMYPFIMDGDVVVTYKLGDYREGDPVVYRRPDTGQVALSRIAAIGPCAVQVEAGDGLLVDGQRREDSLFYATEPLPESDVSYPCTLSPSGVFLLDDSREIGSDSRAFGEVRRWELLGKVVYVFRRRGI